MVAAYSNICSISRYHFGSAVYLAIFAALAHVASLPPLFRYFFRHRLLFVIRLVLMVIIMLLIASSLRFATHIGFFAAANCPVVCSLSSSVAKAESSLSGVNLQDNGHLDVFIISGVVVGYFVLFFIFSRCILRAVLLNKVAHFSLLIVCFVLVGILCTTLYVVVYERSLAGGFLNGSESDWGFGQLLAVFLIVLPLLGAVETFIGKSPTGS